MIFKKYKFAAYKNAFEKSNFSQLRAIFKVKDPKSKKVRKLRTSELIELLRGFELLLCIEITLIPT